MSDEDKETRALEASFDRMSKEAAGETGKWIPVLRTWERGMNILTLGTREILECL